MYVEFRSANSIIFAKFAKFFLHVIFTAYSIQWNLSIQDWNKYTPVLMTFRRPLLYKFTPEMRTTSIIMIASLLGPNGVKVPLHTCICIIITYNTYTLWFFHGLLIIYIYIYITLICMKPELECDRKIKPVTML